jgi:hypothetical protein
MTKKGKASEMGKTKIRCFKTDCINFDKAHWTNGGECSSSQIVISSGRGCCLTADSRPEVEKL